MLDPSSGEQLGEIGAIIPWNVPFMMAAWKLAPALAAGCTVVLKPAEDTSLTALMLADLVAQARIPPGVVNVVTGRGNEAGEALVRHPDVAKISFAGSPRVGRRLPPMRNSFLHPASHHGYYDNYMPCRFDCRSSGRLLIS